MMPLLRLPLPCCCCRCHALDMPLLRLFLMLILRHYATSAAAYVFTLLLPPLRLRHGICLRLQFFTRLLRHTLRRWLRDYAVIDAMPLDIAAVAAKRYGAALRCQPPYFSIRYAVLMSPRRFTPRYYAAFDATPCHHASRQPRPCRRRWLMSYAFFAMSILRRC